MSFDKNIQASRIDGLIEEITILGGLAGSGTLNYIPKFTPDGSTLGLSSIFDNGTNVGISTLSPTSRLHIKGIDSTTSNYALKVENTTGIIGYFRNDGLLNINNGTIDNGEKFIVLGNAKIQPGSAVWHFGWNSGELFLQGSVADGIPILLHNSQSTSYISYQNPTNPSGYNGWSIGRSVNDFKIIGNINNDINGIVTDVVTILGSNGNVGIGTNTPLTKLHVDGGSGSNVQIYLKSTGVDNGIQIDSGAYPFFNMKSNGVTNITMQGVGTNILFRPASNVEWRAVDTNSSLFGSIGMDVAASSYSYYNHNLMVGGSTPSARLHVIGIDFSSSNYALKVSNSVGGNLLSIKNDGTFLSNVYDTTYDITLSGSAGHYTLATPYGDKFEATGTGAFLFTTGTNRGTSGESGITNLFTSNFNSVAPWNVNANRILVGAIGTESGTITGLRIEKSGFTNTAATFYSSIFLDGNVGIGISTPSLAKLQIRGVDATSSNNALYVEDSAASSLLQIRNDGYVRFSNGHGNGVSSFTLYNSGTGAGFDYKGYYGRLALGASNTTVNATLTVSDYGTVQNFINFDSDGSKGSIYGLGGGITFLGKQAGSNRFLISSDDGWLGNAGYRTWFKGRISIGDTPAATGYMIHINALANLAINETFGNTNAVPSGWVLAGDFVIDPPFASGGVHPDCNVVSSSGNSKLLATDLSGGTSTATYTFSTTGYSNIQVKWNEYLKDLGSLLVVKVSHDAFGSSTTLTPTHPTSVDTWTAVPIITLPTNYNDKASVQIRFEYTAVSPSFPILIDDLIITGESIAIRTGSGKIVIDDLAGSGTRTVNVDNEGKLIIGSAPVTGAPVKYSTTFTPGTVNVANTITHSLGTTDISVTLWDVTSGEIILAKVSNRTSTQVDVTFTTNPAGNVRAVIIG